MTLSKKNTHIGLQFEVIGRKRYDYALYAAELQHATHIPGYDAIGDWHNKPTHRLDNGDKGIVLGDVTIYRWPHKITYIGGETFTEQHQVAYIQIEVNGIQFWVQHGNFYINCKSI